MESFFIDYRDPIFGLIILIAVAFIVAFSSYVWAIFSKKDEETKLKNFISKFEDSNSLSQKHIDLLKSINLDIDTFSALGLVFTKTGDFSRAINIYLIALEQAKTKAQKNFILLNLAKAYFEAGFLKKAENVFLQILKFNPRNEEALRLLSVIYEKLKMYDEELDTLDALKEQGVDVDENLALIKAQIIANDNSLKFDKKIKEISKIEFDFTKRFILELFIKTNEPLSKIKKFPPLKNVVDIIWFLNEPVNLKDDEYKALFYAKSLTNEFKQSSFFEINAISAMRNSGFFEADLSFKFMCSKCKNSFPSFFYRCPVCYTLNSIQILPKIIRKDNEANLTF